VSFTLHRSSFTRKQLYRRLQPAYTSGAKLYDIEKPGCRMLCPRGREPTDSYAGLMDVRGIKIALIVGQCPCRVASSNA
jgi:hypothetical protein